MMTYDNIQIQDQNKTVDANCFYRAIAMIRKKKENISETEQDLRIMACDWLRFDGQLAGAEPRQELLDALKTKLTKAREEYMYNSVRQNAEFAKTYTKMQQSWNERHVDSDDEDFDASIPDDDLVSEYIRIAAEPDTFAQYPEIIALGWCLQIDICIYSGSSLDFREIKTHKIPSPLHVYNIWQPDPLHFHAIYVGEDRDPEITPFNAPGLIPFGMHNNVNNVKTTIDKRFITSTHLTVGGIHGQYTFHIKYITWDETKNEPVSYTYDLSDKKVNIPLYSPTGASPGDPLLGFIPIRFYKKPDRTSSFIQEFNSDTQRFATPGEDTFNIQWFSQPLPVEKCIQSYGTFSELLLNVHAGVNTTVPLVQTVKLEQSVGLDRHFDFIQGSNKDILKSLRMLSVGRTWTVRYLTLTDADQKKLSDGGVADVCPLTNDDRDMVRLRSVIADSLQSQRIVCDLEDSITLRDDEWQSIWNIHTRVNLMIQVNYVDRFGISLTSWFVCEHHVFHADASVGSNVKIQTHGAQGLLIYQPIYADVTLFSTALALNKMTSKHTITYKVEPTKRSVHVSMPFDHRDDGMGGYMFEPSLCKVITLHISWILSNLQTVTLQRPNPLCHPLNEGIQRQRKRDGDRKRKDRNEAAKSDINDLKNLEMCTAFPFLNRL